MALKRKVTKAEFESLPQGAKEHYVSEGEGYVLETTGDEDNGALKRAKDRESQLRREAQDRVHELETQLADATHNKSNKDKDIAVLEKSWQAKIDQAASERDKKIESLQGVLKTSLVDNVALAMASKISNSPQLLLPHIKARLQADFDGEAPKTVVLGKDGKPAADMTIEKLSEEFVANKDFATIIVASKASGGATKPANSGGGATNFNPGNGGGSQQGAQPPSLATMKATDLVATIKANKQQSA